MSVMAECNQLSNCCGVLEIGGFFEDGVDDENYRPYYADYRADTWEGLLRAIDLETDTGLLIQMWFKRDMGADLYDHGGLRDLVQQIPGVVRLGEHVNPNTGNTIDGYLWANR